MDIQAIQQSLMDALESQKVAQLQALDAQRNLHHQQLNVGANATGTLFSSAPAFKQASFVADKYIPAAFKIEQSVPQNKIKITNTVADALRKIQALNDATAELNKNTAELNKY